MFDFKIWIVDTLVSGVKGNKFSKEYAEVQLANYYALGKISETEIERFEKETYIPEPNEDEFYEEDV